MIEYVRRSTANKMWALPGAVLKGRPRLDVVEGNLHTDPHSPADVQMVCPSYLIEHPRGLVLFDTGLSPKGMRDPEPYLSDIQLLSSGALKMTDVEVRPELGVDNQIQGLGYKLSQVTYVIPSHLHFDHAGGLYLFPGATFLVGAGELDFAYQAHANLGTGFGFRLEDMSPTRSFDWIEIGHDFDLFGDGSVVLLNSPGHTAGSIALFVRLPQRNFILTGDACHYPAELELGICWRAQFSPSMGSKSLRRLRLIRDAWDAQFWIGHDMADWNAWPHAPEFVD